MNNSLKCALTLLLCALWLTPALSAHATQDETKKAAPAATKKAAPKKAKAKKGEESAEMIKAKLDTMGKQLVVKAAATVTPCINKKAVRAVDDGFVACYTEINTKDIVTELIQSTGSGGQYIGSIKYRESLYECHGKTKEEALKAPCTKVKARRMNELVRYDGKWRF